MPVAPSHIVSTLMTEHARLVAYINIIVRDEHMAEDILQTVAIAAIEKADTITDADHLGGWLRHAARLEARHVLRQSKRESQMLDDSVLDLLEAQFEDASTPKANDQKAALKECLALVEGYPRQVLEMRYRDGLTSGQIAEQMDKRSDAIYRVLTRVRAQLRDCIEARLARLGEVCDD